MKVPQQQPMKMGQRILQLPHQPQQVAQQVPILEKNIQVATTTGVREGLKKAVILLKNEGIDNKIISKVLELN